MLRNYLKIAGRGLWRNRLFTAINVGGLTIGVAVAMLTELRINNDPAKSLRTD